MCARCNSFQHWEERTAQKLAAASQLMRCSAVCEALKKKKKKKIKLEVERSKTKAGYFSSCKCFSSRIRTLSAIRYLALIRFLCIVQSRSARIDENDKNISL